MIAPMPRGRIRSVRRSGRVSSVGRGTRLSKSRRGGVGSPAARRPFGGPWGPKNGGRSVNEFDRRDGPLAPWRARPTQNTRCVAEKLIVARSLGPRVNPGGRGHLDGGTAYPLGGGLPMAARWGTSCSRSVETHGPDERFPKSETYPHRTHGGSVRSQNRCWI